MLLLLLLQRILGGGVCARFVPDLEFALPALPAWLAATCLGGAYTFHRLRPDGRRTVRPGVQTGAGDIRCSDVSQIPLLPFPCEASASSSHVTLPSCTPSAERCPPGWTAAPCCPVSGPPVVYIRK